MVKKKDVHYCGNIVNQTLNQSVDTLHCPFVAKVTVVGDKKAITRECRKLCNASLFFSGPHDIIAYNLKMASASAGPEKSSEEKSVSDVEVEEEEDYEEII